MTEDNSIYLAMNATKIEPSTCYFIASSRLGKLSDPATEAMDTFFNSDLDVSFGDANRTLIDIPTFLSYLERSLEQADIFYDQNENVHPGFLEIKAALEDYQHTVYIDLEN